MEYSKRSRGFGYSRPNYNRGSCRNPHQTNYLNDHNFNRQQNGSNFRQDYRHNPYRPRKAPDYRPPPPYRTNPIESDIVIPLSPLEQKIETIVNAVRSQEFIGELVFINNDEHPTALLQNTINSVNNLAMNIVQNNTNNTSELCINGKKFAETDVQGKQQSKRALCEIVINNLKDNCFHIIKKKCYEEVSTEKSAPPETQPGPSNSMEGSKAHQMMLKMGWGGKGLGAKEQGVQKSVAEILSENITKEGLGSTNVLAKVQDILKDFAYSTKMSTLAFDSSFTKEERAQIHTVAAKYNLKSKSEGKEENRRITISKKLQKWDLVKELLRIGLENECYKLIIPKKFEHLWQD